MLLLSIVLLPLPFWNFSTPSRSPSSFSRSLLRASLPQLQHFLSLVIVLVAQLRQPTAPQQASLTPLLHSCEQIPHWSEAGTTSSLLSAIFTRFLLGLLR